MRIVPSLEPLEDGHPRLGLALKPAPVQHFSLQRGEEALGHGIVIRIAGGPHRGHHPGFAAALTERIAGVLTAAIRVVNDRLGPALRQGHVQGTEDELGLEVRLHRPADDAPRPPPTSARR